MAAQEVEAALLVFEEASKLDFMLLRCRLRRLRAAQWTDRPALESAVIRAEVDIMTTSKSHGNKRETTAPPMGCDFVQLNRKSIAAAVLVAGMTATSFGRAFLVSLSHRLITTAFAVNQTDAQEHCFRKILRFEPFGASLTLGDRAGSPKTSAVSSPGKVIFGAAAKI